MARKSPKSAPPASVLDEDEDEIEPTETKKLGEVEQLRAELALSKEREASAEAARIAARKEADDQHARSRDLERALKIRTEETTAESAARHDAETRAVMAEERARQAEAQHVGRVNILPAEGPYRLRLALLTARDETAKRTLTAVIGGQTYEMSQENRRGLPHNPRLERVVETSDRHAAEYLIGKRFVEVAPPARPQAQ